MKDFFINVGKALCYFAFFILTQFIVTYAYMTIELIRVIAGQPEQFFDDFMNNFMAIYQDIALKTVNATDFLYIFIFALSIVILTIFFRMRKTTVRKETWMKPFKLTSAWAIPIAAVCASLVTYFIICYIPWPESVIEQYVYMSETATGASNFWAIAAACILAPILEEIIFRGLIFTRLCRAVSASSAAILTAALFAAVHGNLIWIVYAFICGIILLLIYVKYRSLYASILFHMIFNLWGGFMQPMLFTGVNPAAELSIIGAGVVIGAIIAYVLYKMPRSKIDISAVNQAQP